MPSWRPHDGQTRRRRFHSSAFFDTPAYIITYPTAGTSTSSRVVCGSIGVIRPSFGSVRATRVWMRSVVQLPTPPIGYVGVELRRREVGVSEHLLDAAQIRAAFEQVCRERVPEQVRVHALRLQANPVEEEVKALTKHGQRRRRTDGCIKT